MKCDYLIVGGGITGCILAERIACDLKAEVVVVERSNRPGGLCASSWDAAEEVYRPLFGIHTIHTSRREVYDYLHGLCYLVPYNHRVAAYYRGIFLSIPSTETALAGVLPGYERTVRGATVNPGCRPANLEEEWLHEVGPIFYDAIVKPYLVKQMGREPRDLLPSTSPVAKRLRPLDAQGNGNYFGFTNFQGIPYGGYDALFERLLASPRIGLELGRDYLFATAAWKPRKLTIYTGRLDLFFGSCFGSFDRRFMRFDEEKEPVKSPDRIATVTFPDMSIRTSRSHKSLRHIDGNWRPVASDRVLNEVYDGIGDENLIFPLRTIENGERWERYRKLASRTGNVLFCGRLAAWPELDIDSSIAAALRIYERKIKPRH